MANPEASLPWGKIALFVISFGIIVQIITSSYGGPTSLSLLQGSGRHRVLTEALEGVGKRKIVKVTSGVYLAIGYALGNSILLEAPQGAIVVDTTENMDAARAIAASFRNITKAPIKAILYTHHHPDHVFGTKAFLEGREDRPQIWAHKLFLREKQRTSETAPAFFTRAMRQFGSLIPDDITGFYKLRLSSKTEDLGELAPTHFLRTDSEDVEIAGLSMQLLHLPGETTDHMCIWIPSMKLLMPGDDIYQSFPNLYALRGSIPRDTMTWVKSLDKMRKLKPEILLPSHTHPVYGNEKIDKLLKDYRDGIQFVHDQTVRYINRGFHPDDIVPLVNLPEELRNHPYLTETYGTVRWSVKGVYSNYMGWFSGKVPDIESMTKKKKVPTATLR